MSEWDVVEPEKKTSSDWDVVPPVASEFETEPTLSTTGTAPTPVPGPLPSNAPTVLSKAVATGWRALGESAKMVAGTTRLFQDHSIPATEEEMQVQREWWTNLIKSAKEPETREYAMKARAHLERQYAQKYTTTEYLNNINTGIDKMLTKIGGAYDPKQQPTSFIGKIAAGIVEFLPQAPLFEFTGGPFAAPVKAALEKISIRYGDAVAILVARELPTAMAKSKKYLVDIGIGAVEEGTKGAAATLVTGGDPEEALKTGGEFAAARSIFGVFTDALGGLFRTMTKAPSKSSVKETVSRIKPDPRSEVEMRTAGGTEKFREAKSTGDWQRDMAIEMENTRAHNPETRTDKNYDPRFDTPVVTDPELRQFYREGQLRDRVDAFNEKLKQLSAEEIAAQKTELNRERADLQKDLDAFHKGKTISFEEIQQSEFPSEREHWKDFSGEVVENQHMPEEAMELTPFFDDVFKAAERYKPIKSVFEFTRKISEKVRDKFYLDGVRHLSGAGLENEAFALANADIAAPRIVDNLIAYILGPELYQNETAKGALTRFLIKDRLVAVHEYNKKHLSDLRSQESTLEAERIQLEENMIQHAETGDATAPEYQQMAVRRDAVLKEQADLKDNIAKQEALIAEQKKAHNFDLYKAQIEKALKEDALEVYKKRTEPVDISGKVKQLKASDKWKGEPVRQTMVDEQGDALLIEGDKEAAAAHIWQNIVQPIDHAMYPWELQFRMEKLHHVIDRWKEVVNPLFDSIYRDTMNIPKDAKIGERGQYGHYTGTNIRLIAKDSPIGGTRPKKKKGKKDYSHETDSIGPSRGSASTGSNPLAQRAHGTGEYTTWMEKNLYATMMQGSSSWGDGNYSNALKERFYKAAEEKGVMAFTRGEKEMPSTPAPEGQHWVLVSKGQVKRPFHDNVTGKSVREDRTAWALSSVAEEVRGVLDLDPKMPSSKTVRAITYIQLKQLADFVVHGKNLFSEVVRSQGKGEAADWITRIPILGQVHAGTEIAKVFREVRNDSPAIRKELAELAEMGTLRSQHGKDDIVPTAKWLWEIDTASRILLNRYYKELVGQGKAVGSLEARRKFINQVGQYNERLMNQFERAARRFGFSPFLVAGRTFNRQAFRWATGYSGIKDAPGEDAMRNKNLSGTMMAATIPMMINMYTTGSPFGRPGTPLLAVDLGQPKKEDGTIDVIDVGQWGGQARFMRIFGLNAVYEGTRGGQNAEQIALKAAEDAALGVTHPYTGPPVTFSMDWKRTNLLEAAQKLNPLFSFFGTPKYGRFEKMALAQSDGKQTAASRTARVVDSFLRSPSGAAGLKSKRAPLSAMEKTVIEKRGKYGAEKTEETVAKLQARREAEHAYATGGDSAMIESIIDSYNKGTILDLDYAQDIWRDRELSQLQRGFKTLNVENAIEAYREGTPQEKAATFTILEEKVNNKKDSDKRAVEWYAFVEAAKSELLQMIETGIVAENEVYFKESE